MTIIVDPNSLTTSYSFMTSSGEDVDFDDTIGYACMTATTVSTSVASSINERVYAQDANKYVDSLSIEELCMLENMVSDRCTEIENNASVKVYKKA